MSFRIRTQRVPDLYATITIPAGVGIVTQTHTNKVFANCRLRLMGWRDNNDGSGTFPYIQLSQSGSDVVVTATRFGTATSDIVIRYAVEEYLGHVIKSIQRFLIQDPGTGVPIAHTVSQIGPFFSLTHLGTGTTDNSSGNVAQWCMEIAYDGVTTVTGTPGSNPGAVFITTSCELTEWY